MNRIRNYFQFQHHKTSFKQETIAGLTTFVTMAYIIVVNPKVLEAAGMPFEASIVATILSAFFGTLIMGVYAKRPFAIAPYMGENAFIAFTVVKIMGYSWQVALGAIFISGVIFILLTLTKIRVWMVEAIPASLKHSFTGGIGLFLTFIGLNEMGVVKMGIPDAPVQMGNLSETTVLLSIFTFIFIVVLMIRKVRGSILIGILFTTFIALGIGQYQTNTVQLSGDLININETDKYRLNTESKVLAFQGVMSQKEKNELLAIVKDTGKKNTKAIESLYQQSNKYPALPGQWISLPSSIEPIFFQLDILGALNIGMLNIVLIIFVMTFVDTIGTLIGASARAGFLDKNGNLPDIEKPMMADAVSMTIASSLGTVTTGTYIESCSGIEAGGRTGFTSVVTAFLFLSALFFGAFFQIIPAYAYAPALVVIGVLMLSSITKIQFEDLTEAIPAFSVIVLMSFTYNIGVGICGGFLLYSILKLISGRVKEVHSGLWILSLLSLLFFIFYPYH